MATVVVAILWFLGYAGLLLCIEPGNPELWVMGLIPLWLVFCGVVLLPLTVDNRLWLPFAMLLMLFVHNGAGGIGVLGDPAKAKAKLGWEPEITVGEMCAEMVANDLSVAKRHALLKEHGFDMPVTFES